MEQIDGKFTFSVEKPNDVNRLDALFWYFASCYTLSLGKVRNPDFRF